MNIVMIGPPCAGKGTQASFLSQSYGFRHFSTGALYRAEAEAKTEFGLEAKNYWGNGGLCPDEMTNELMRLTIGKLEDKDKIIFDGYPRSVVQARYLDSLCEIHFVIDLQVPVEEVLIRLSERAKTEARCDDTEEGIRKRLAIYESNIGPIIEYYKRGRTSKYVPINGVADIDKVSAAIYVGMLKAQGLFK